MKYIDLVEVYENLEKNKKRLQKTFVISRLLTETKDNELPEIILLVQGRIFPYWDERVIGVASRIVLKAISIATGKTLDKVEQQWKKLGDLGLVAEKLTEKKSQSTLFSSELEVSKVYNNLKKLASLVGKGTVDKKLQLISELLTSAKPKEAKYIIRTVLQDLRVGVGEGVLRDSILWAYFKEELEINYNEEENKLELKDREEYNKYLNTVQQSYDMTTDFSLVAKKAKHDSLAGLKKLNITVGKPVKVMLALKVNDVKEGFERCDKPAVFQYKYDGFRLQIHKKNDKIQLFTRRLEEVTERFPEVVKNIIKNVNAKEIILDSEAVGYEKKSGKYMPFQYMSQRIKRKYEIDKLAEDYPVEVNVFDVLYLDGEPYLDKSYDERLKKIQKIINNNDKKIKVANTIISSDENEAETFFSEAVKSGNEGLMIKKLDAKYKPGSRVGYMVKWKPEIDSLDLVITGAEWGEGKRANWLSSFTLSCTDGNELLEIGKVSTGLKEKDEEGLSFNEMTKILKPLIIKEKGKSVQIEPKIIIEVSYDEIQKSPSYSSKFALRFPRVKNIRNDKKVEDASALEYIEELYNNQKKK